MTFLDLETSKRLVEMGCRGTADFWYLKSLETNEYEERAYYAPDGQDRSKYACPAFTLEDLVGTHAQARENARLVWGGGGMADPSGWPHLRHRHAMIDASDWREYLRNSLKGEG